MLNTRSQLARNNSVDMSGMDRDSDAESESSLPEILARDQTNEFDNGDLLKNQNDTERHILYQRFSEINKQINELTNLVSALTKKIFSSNRERNDLNSVSNRHETRSNVVTGASTSNVQTNLLRPSSSHYTQPPAH